MSPKSEIAHGGGEKSHNNTKTIKDLLNALSKVPYDKLKDIFKSKENGKGDTSSPHNNNPGHTTIQMTTTHATTTHATTTQRHVRIMATKRKAPRKKIFG